MLAFSVVSQAVFDLDIEYEDAPDDLIEISVEEHQMIFSALNSGCIIFSDLTVSAPKPSKFHEWNGTDWVDPRSEDEKLTYKRSQYPKLTRYQFMRCLLENGYKSEMIEAKILMTEDEMTRELTLLGFKEATNFVRTDDSILAMQSVLNLTDERVDEMWEYALTL